MDRRTHAAVFILVGAVVATTASAAVPGRHGATTRDIPRVVRGPRTVLPASPAPAPAAAPFEEGMLDGGMLDERTDVGPRGGAVTLSAASHFGYEDTLREALSGGYGAVLLDAGASREPILPPPPPPVDGDLYPQVAGPAPCPLVIDVGHGLRRPAKTRVVSGRPSCS